MSTQFDVDVSAISEFEFSTPCQKVDADGNPVCNEQVVVYLSKSHSLSGCSWAPFAGLCKPHFDLVLSRFADWLSVGERRGISCAKCNQFITGTLESNTRVMWV